ncbi:MAG: hypothetical protein IPP81_14730 [Chitinophagaceae bacterium]|nr:hypothetical protein [Chitinophagaceae bacterium]
MKTIKKLMIWVAIIAIPVIIASCKKSDPAPASKPTISTNAAINITANTATGGGYIGDSSTYYRVTGRGIMYSSGGDPIAMGVIASQTYDNLATPNRWGSFPSSMTGLTPNTTYYVRAYVGWELLSTPGSNMIFGELRTFKTLP